VLIPGDGELGFASAAVLARGSDQKKPIDGEQN
jgi:hypothetical protein